MENKICLASRHGAQDMSRKQVCNGSSMYWHKRTLQTELQLYAVSAQHQWNTSHTHTHTRTHTHTHTHTKAKAFVTKVRSERGLSINKPQVSMPGCLVADESGAEVRRWLVEAWEDLDSKSHKAVPVPASVFEAVVEACSLAVGAGRGGGGGGACNNTLVQSK